VHFAIVTFISEKWTSPKMPSKKGLPNSHHDIRIETQTNIITIISTLNAIILTR
jgi:hypothetical protein